MRIRYASFLAALLLYACIYFLGYLVGGVIGFILGGLLLFYDYAAPSVTELAKKTLLYSIAFFIAFNGLLSLRYVIACSTMYLRFLCRAFPSENGFLFSPSSIPILLLIYFVPAFVVALIIGFVRRLIK